MLEIKLTRRCVLKDDECSNAALIISKNEENCYFVIAFLDNDITSYSVSYNQKDWEKLRREGDYEADEEFIAELANLENELYMKCSEYLEVKWIRPDEDGLTFEFCAMMLRPNGSDIFNVVDALLEERDILRSNAATSATVIADLERKLELLGKKVEEMENYNRNLSNTLITKFVILQNRKVSG